MLSMWVRTKLRSYSWPSIMSLPDVDFFVRTRITDFIRAVKWNVRFRNEHQELLLPIVNWVSGVLERLTHPGRFHEVIRNVCWLHNKVPAQGSPGLRSQPLFPSQRKTFIPGEVSMLALCELSESLITRWICLPASPPVSVPRTVSLRWISSVPALSYLLFWSSWKVYGSLRK